MKEIWLIIISNLVCSQFAVLMFAKIENKKENDYLDYRLFKTMLLTIIVILLIHSAALFLYGAQTVILKIILRICVSLLMPTAAFLCMTYAIHIEKVTNKIVRREKFWIFPYTLLFFMIVGLSIASVFTGWFFVFDENGYFHSGRFLYVPIILSFGYILMALAVIVRRKKNINITEFRNLISVPIPMIVGGSLQSFLQEYPIILPSCVLSLFLVYANIQERRLSFDHLTGAYNRQKLDEFLEMIIENTKTSDKPFAALLADVNHFKHINDNFGHTEGDKALVTVVDIISAGIRNLDFLARYAGDEFVVVFPNCVEEQLNGIIDRINKGFAEYSAREKRYPLSISIGAAFFDPGKDRDSEAFVKRLDSLMYENKQDFHGR